MNRRLGRVLVVDDNEPARYAKVRILRHAGYEVGEAANGAEALGRVAEEPPDLVLLDVHLPDMTGLEVCRRIKRDPGASQVLVLQTSASMRDDQAKIAGLEGGADGYVVEPMEPSLLVATVAAFLRIRKAEQAVREHAAEWQTTFNAITDGVVVADPAGNVLRFNRAFGKLFDRPEAELTGASLDDLLPPPEQEPSLWTNLTSGKRLDTERPLAERIFGLSADPVFDAEGTLRGAVCIVCDVTDRKRMMDRLGHTQKLESIGLLAGGVAHDFNNLLTGIMGNAGLALDNLENPPVARRTLEDIMRASRQAADLTRQLLAYSGKGKFVVRPIDLSRTVRSMLPLVRTSFSPKVQLDLHLSKDLPATEADQTQVEQIVMNLLINAAEAIGDKPGRVAVTTKTVHVEDAEGKLYLSDREVRGDYVMLQVEDNGPGMSAETVKQIFDPFFSTKFLGRGLGLSAVLGILRSHKGAIRVTSTPGEGSCFQLLFLPAARPADAPEAEPSAAGAAEGRGTILVVEDEQLVREFFRSALEHFGYEVVEAANGSDALRIFAKEPYRFALVLLDLVMPVLSGKEVLPKLFEIRPDIRVAVTSGQVEEEVRRELASWPVAAFIQKPCGMQELVKKVQQGTGPRVLVAR